MGARVLDKNGKEVTPIMGSYGIGIERILTAAIEQDNDDNGFWLAPAIAPFRNRGYSDQRGRREILSTAVDIAGAFGSSRIRSLCWMTGMSGLESSSRTPIWWVSPLESRSGRRLLKVLWKWFGARLAKCRMLAFLQ